MSAVSNVSSTSYSSALFSSPYVKELEVPEEAFNQSDVVTISDEGRAKSTPSQLDNVDELDPLDIGKANRSLVGRFEGYEYETQNFSAEKVFDSGTKVSINATVYVPKAGQVHDIMSLEDIENGLTEKLIYKPESEVYVTITKTDGTSATFRITENTSFSEDENGNLIINEGKSAPNEYANLNAKDKNNIPSHTESHIGSEKDELHVIVSMTQHIDTGGGDDTIMLLASKEEGNFKNGLDPGIRSLDLRDGNNTVIASNSYKIDILGENGDNTISGTRGNIVLGDGNNTIKDIEYAQNIVLGNGNNTISSESGEEVESLGFNSYSTSILNLHVGDGNNTMDIKHAGYIKTGDGNNTFTAQTSRGLSFGDGDNDIKIEEFDGLTAFISLGDGNNDVEIEKIDNSMSTIEAGDGNNDIKVKELETNQSKLKMGDGNNDITIDNYSVTMSYIDVGNGNNTMNISSFNSVADDMSLGDGNNTLDVDTYSTVFSDIEAGDGDNTLEVDTYTSVSTDFIFGDGNNAIYSNLFAGLYSNISFGNGNNTIEAEKFYSYFNKVEFGNGDNDIKVENFTSSHLEFSLGSGNNTIDVDNFVTSLSLFTVGNGLNNILMRNMRAELFGFNAENEDNILSMTNTKGESVFAKKDKFWFNNEEMNKEIANRIEHRYLEMTGALSEAESE